MKEDAHYYAILAFARACGFTKEAAWSVAYASQFVDDAKINQLSIIGSTYGIKPDHDSPPSLLNMATCHTYTRIKTFNYGAMINNTCAFHFVPGCEGEEFGWKMVCRPNSKIIKPIAKETESENDPVKLGILLHVWADSFSHEGFSGLLSKVNDVTKVDPGNRAYLATNTLIPRFIMYIRHNIIRKRFDTIFDYMVPAYGHAQALHYPDEPYLIWSYEYDQQDIYYHNHFREDVKNPKRYQNAFESIKTILKNFLINNPQYRDPSFPNTPDHFESLFSALLLDAKLSQRINNWKNTIKRLKLFGPEDAHLLEYDKGEKWFKEAFVNYDKKRFEKRIVLNVKIDKEFANSHWYRYYTAVKWYKNRFHYYANQEGLSFDHWKYLQ
jgi:hypothetical protein